ncbi:hypothetical protein PBI_THONKO_41 [Mycobacterium phage Thonko]|uniref:Uncharacterized protein n=1 Tax=Mycobacterium phage Thonko TaxID=2282910 RepID=A0A346FC88_9CAUD|nr:minor tail protein [Mycobacterium phage Thonko]AXN53313.1 hypothetical protein PBI_THONKO_41 [Mycobacterium phage Thonko]
MTIRLPLPGQPPVVAIKVGTTDVKQFRIGQTLYWSKSSVRDPFDLDGWLQGWINELQKLGGLFVNPFGELFGSMGDESPLGWLVNFTPGNSILGSPGTLISGVGNLEDAYCAAVGTVADITRGDIPEGLIGLINGLPIIGEGGRELIEELLDFIFGGGDPVTNILSIVGQVPIVGELGVMLGLLPKADGTFNDPVNFIVDAAGEVIGKITCGEWQPNEGTGGEMNFVIGVQDAAARMFIPDGLVGIGKQTSRFRHPAQTVGDDGWLEVQIDQIGSPGYATQVFRRWANAGGASGVGMDFRDGVASIVRRVGGTDTIIRPGLAAIASGDVFRLHQEGNLHTLIRNGKPVGEWPDDAATAAKGAANRSVAMVMQGARELMGVRRYSPSLNYLDAA